MMSYYLGLAADESDNANLVVGNLVHKGMEDHYNGGDIMENILQIEQEHAAIGLLNTEVPYEPDANIELSKLMLEGYLEWVEESGVDANLIVTGVEEPLEVSLGEIAGREVILHGRVDARFLDPDGNTLLLDHKTTSNFGDLVDRRLRLNEQLLTYALLLRLSKGEEVHGAALNMLRKVKRSARAKPPFYSREFVYFNVEQIRNHYKHVVSVIEDILRLEDQLKEDSSLTNPHAYTTVSKDCTWKCPFLAVCPMVDDGSNIEGALKALYKVKEAA